MEIGIDSFAATSTDNDSNKNTQSIAHLLERIEPADKVGLDVFGIGEHHRRFVGRRKRDDFERRAFAPLEIEGDGAHAFPPHVSRPWPGDVFRPIAGARVSRVSVSKSSV